MSDFDSTGRSSLFDEQVKAEDLRVKVVNGAVCSQSQITLSIAAPGAIRTTATR